MLKSYITFCFTPWFSFNGNYMVVIQIPWKCFFTLDDIAYRSILSFAIMVIVSRVRWLATNTPSRSYFFNMFKLILLQIERHKQNGQPNRKETLNNSFCAKKCIQFQTNINWYKCFSLLNMSTQRGKGDRWWVTCHLSVSIQVTSCAMVLDNWLKPFSCESHPSISKEHIIWSCIGTEAPWQSGGKELLKVLVTVGMACFIGDTSPTIDVTKVARFVTHY